MTRSGCALLVLAALVCLSKPAVAQLGVQEIVQRSVAANEADWKASAEYGYGETDRDKEGTKTYRVMMIDGSPYNRLIAVNGKPLSEEAAQREQHKLEKTVAKRQSESSGERAERIEKYKKELHRNERFIAEITQGFQFKMLGDDRVDGHAVYVLEATPRPGYHPSTNEAKVLTGMQGKLWIDKQTFQWVKVEAQVMRPVSIEGFLARVEPGTRFELENAPVTGQVWLPKHFAMSSDAKVIGVFDKRSQANETYFNYRKTSDQHAATQADSNASSAHR